MSPAEQEQRVLCEVLRGYGYDVEMREDEACWMGTSHRFDFVWVRGMVWPPFHAEVQGGPVCRTAEQVVEWILANVPRPQDRSATEVTPTLPSDSVAAGG